MAKKHYEVNNTTKQVFVDMVKVTEAEKKVIKNYLDLGYVSVAIEKPKTKKATEEEKKANPFSEQNIQSFLKSKGTAEQNKKYWDLYNQQAKDKVTKQPTFYKTNSKDGRFKAGDPKPVGHIGTLRWFKAEFPNYNK